MKIHKVLSQHYNDYTAEMVCEHCAHIGVDKSGYSDGFYYAHVIPSMLCAHCGLNSGGTVTPTSPNVNVRTL